VDIILLAIPWPGCWLKL